MAEVGVWLGEKGLRLEHKFGAKWAMAREFYPFTYFDLHPNGANTLSGTITKIRATFTPILAVITDQPLSAFLNREFLEFSLRHGGYDAVQILFCMLSFWLLSSYTINHACSYYVIT